MVAHDPNTHKQLSMSTNFRQNKQIYVCLTEGCPYREEVELTLPIILGVKRKKTDEIPN